MLKRRAFLAALVLAGAFKRTTTQSVTYATQQRINPAWVTAEYECLQAIVRGGVMIFQRRTQADIDAERIKYGV